MSFDARNVTFELAFLPVPPDRGQLPGTTTP